MVPRTLMDIFNSPHQDATIEISFIEIYNKGVYDLLTENSQDKLSIGQNFMGGTKRLVRELEDARRILSDGNKNRHVRKTNMNASSSRSHAIFTIHVVRANTQSAMNLVDLAGSEGIRRTDHAGDALTEGNNINTDLLHICNVLRALAEKQKMIPYRSSKVTTVLHGTCEVLF